MSERVMTIAFVLDELRRLLPARTFATVTVHEHGEMNRPENIVRTINSAEIYVEGGYWFRGASLQEAMGKFHEWLKETIR